MLSVEPIFIDIKVVSKSEGSLTESTKTNLLPVGIKLTAPTIYELEDRCLFHSVILTCV